VIWDAGNSVEIIVPPDYKSRTCGLCGNYNNNPEDDLQTKKGLIVTDIDKFTHSWKV
jgi:integrin beta 3